MAIWEVDFLLISSSPNTYFHEGVLAVLWLAGWPVGLLTGWVWSPQPGRWLCSGASGWLGVLWFVVWLGGLSDFLARLVFVLEMMATPVLK